jgi:Zn-dependent protease/predicted transcriptional regulator
MKDSIRLGRVAGVKVGFHWSLLVIAALLATGLATNRLPADAPGYSDLAYWIAAVVTAIAFLAAVLIHEVSHAVVARHEGIEVDGITLWLLGGVTRMRGDAPTPGAELRVSGAGPLASLVIGVVLLGLGIGLDAANASALVVAVLVWLGFINIVLAVFNVLPGAPLDGGRLLHAVLWHYHGDRFRATRTASRAGQVLGWALVALGFVEFAFGSGLGGGLWLALLGWFLITAARAEEERALVQEALGSRRVADVMTPVPAVVPASVAVRDFVDDYLLAHRHSAFPVVGPDGHPVGLVTLERVRAVPAPLRATTSVGDIAVPMDRIPVAHPEEPAKDLLERVAEGDGVVLVVDHDRIAGIVTATDLERLAQRVAAVR